MNKKSRLMAGVFLATMVAAGCAGPAQTAKKAAPAAPAALSGKVAETMDGGGYTYISLDRDGQKTWVAIPTTHVTVGQEIKLMPGAEMNNFPSKALNRTFDKIIFSGGVEGSQPAAQGGADKGAKKPAAYEPPILSGKVVETMDAGTYTYIRLEKDGKSGWSAVPTAKVTVGDVVEVLPGTEMGQFTSKSLNRTFDNIYFSSGIKAAGAAAPAAKGEAAAPAAAGKNQSKGEAAALPAGHPKLDAAAAAKPAAPAAEQAAPAAPAQAPAPLVGKVVETKDSGGYTYVCVESEGKKTWVAMPVSEVKVGQEIKVKRGVMIPKFVSKSMNKTFEEIMFSDGLAN